MNTDLYNDIKVRSVQEIENEITECKSKVVSWFCENPHGTPLDKETLIANERAKALEWVLGVRT